MINKNRAGVAPSLRATFLSGMAMGTAATVGVTQAAKLAATPGGAGIVAAMVGVLAFLFSIVVLILNSLDDHKRP